MSEKTETSIENNIPTDYRLIRKYSGPFAKAHTLLYSLPKPGKVNLKVVDERGQVVRTLAEKNQSAGSYELTWDAADDSGNPVSSGTYYFKFSSGSFNQTVKLVYMK